ncbi:PASTA domain-containing protein [Roseimaritima sediminicola]|uniref:PASTA domain-containing protein n=1 Tax=Roseimaritima sediminicola TaxID=2662066 RepID=UPI001386B624|nr:PASTA domain-containing protein [Roseimaritima sediminicola]
MIACLVLLSAIAADPGSGVATPDLKGESMQRGVQLLRLRGLEPLPGVYFISPDNWRADIKPQTVYLQFPRAGATVDAGSPVAVWRFERARRRQAKLKVPDLVGKTWQAAQEALDAAELPLMNATEAAGATDTVTDQYPKAGRQVYRGTSVFLKVLPNPH